MAIRMGLTISEFCLLLPKPWTTWFPKVSEESVVNLACVAGVEGEGKGKREKRAREARERVGRGTVPSSLPKLPHSF